MQFEWQCTVEPTSVLQLFFAGELFSILKISVNAQLVYFDTYEFQIKRKLIKLKTNLKTQFFYKIGIFKDLFKFTQVSFVDSNLQS